MMWLSAICFCCNCVVFGDPSVYSGEGFDFFGESKNEREQHQNDPKEQNNKKMKYSYNSSDNRYSSNNNGKPFVNKQSFSERSNIVSDGQTMKIESVKETDNNGEKSISHDERVFERNSDGQWVQQPRKNKRSRPVNVLKLIPAVKSGNGKIGLRDSVYIKDGKNLLDRSSTVEDSPLVPSEERTKEYISTRAPSEFESASLPLLKRKPRLASNRELSRSSSDSVEIGDSKLPLLNFSRHKLGAYRANSEPCQPINSSFYQNEKQSLTKEEVADVCDAFLEFLKEVDEIINEATIEGRVEPYKKKIMLYVDDSREKFALYMKFVDDFLNVVRKAANSEIRQGTPRYSLPFSDEFGSGEVIKQSPTTNEVENKIFLRKVLASVNALCKSSLQDNMCTIAKCGISGKRKYTCSNEDCEPISMKMFPEEMLSTFINKLHFLAYVIAEEHHLADDAYIADDKLVNNKSMTHGISNHEYVENAPVKPIDQYAAFKNVKVIKPNTQQKRR